MKTRILKALLFLAGTPLLAAAAPPAGEIPSLRGLPRVERMDAAADQGIRYFQEMAAGRRAKGLGVTAAEAPGLSRGRPLLHYYVTLDALRSYHPGQDPRSLFSNRYYEVSYPLQDASAAVRSSVTLGWKDGTWKVAAVGGASGMRQWDAFRAEKTGSLGLDPGDFFTVRVYPLHVEFLAYTDASSRLMFVPEDVGEVRNLRKGAALPAEEALLKLVPAALEHNDRVAY